MPQMANLKIELLLSQENLVFQKTTCEILGVLHTSIFRMFYGKKIHIDYVHTKNTFQKYLG